MVTWLSSFLQIFDSRVPSDDEDVAEVSPSLVASAASSSQILPSPRFVEPHVLNVLI
eukprot:m.10452 g.10452  ORF g.10452 m.10452 type:complete len:57 (-) comp13431_c0_seq2:172-342(-)